MRNIAKIARDVLLSDVSDQFFLLIIKVVEQGTMYTCLLRNSRCLFCLFLNRLYCNEETHDIHLLCILVNLFIRHSIVVALLQNMVS